MHFSGLAQLSDQTSACSSMSNGIQPIEAVINLLHARRSLPAQIGVRVYPT
jgi:hypothetical protein